MFNTLKVNPVVILPESGTQIDTDTEISITCPVVYDHVIRYTIDGSMPNASSPIYSGPFTLPEGLPADYTVYVRSYATSLGINDGPVVSSSFMVTEPVILQVATPVITPPGGEITTAEFITLFCATAGADIFYTVDGTDPDVGSTPYITPFHLSHTSLADPTKWVGAYNFEDDVGANLVTAAPGGTCNVKINPGNVLAPIIVGGPSGSVFCSDHSSSGGGNSTVRGFVTPSPISPTELTIAFFMKIVNGGQDIHLSTDGVSPHGGFVPLTNSIYNNSDTPFTFSSTVPLSDGAWHHYALTWAAADNEWTAYRDGVAVATATSTGTFDFQWLAMNTSVGGARTGYGDNLCVILEKLSAEAVAFLATGGMPAADGTLGGGDSVTVKAIGIKAGLTDSEIASEDFTVNEAPPFSFVWGGSASYSYDQVYQLTGTFGGMSPVSGMCSKVHPVSGKLSIPANGGNVWATDGHTISIIPCQSGTSPAPMPSAGLVGNRMVLQWRGPGVVGQDPLARSDDGVTWTPYSGPYAVGGGYGQGMSSSDLYFVHCGETGSGPSISYSLDGVSWTPATFPDAAGQAGGVAAYGMNVVFVGIASGLFRCQYSVDGGVTFANSNLHGTALAVALGPIFGTPSGFYMYAAGAYWYSPTGATWTGPVTATGLNDIIGIHENGVVATFNGTGDIYYSENGDAFAPVGLTISGASFWAPLQAS